jgi:ELWxxDGT repeat protein
MVIGFKTFAGPSDPSNLTLVGPTGLLGLQSTLFFTTFDAAWGQWQLWTSDGTTRGTRKVTDLQFTRIHDLTAAGSRLFFAASDSKAGDELWTSDGTARGTFMVKDINPGFSSSTPSKPTAAGGVVFFFADDGQHGSELWKSDGTAAGTVLVKDIRPGKQGSSLGLPDLRFTVSRGLLYFFASSDSKTNDVELWRSDGTPGGTSKVAGNVHIYNPVSLDGSVYFIAGDDAHGLELWKTSGAGGAVMVKDLVPGPRNGYWGGPLVVGPDHAIYYDGVERKDTTNPDGTVTTTFLYGLTRSDGTAAGTHVLIYRDPSRLTPPTHTFSVDATNMRTVHGLLFFVGRTPSSAWQLMKSDGTSGGTVVVPSGSLSSVPFNVFFLGPDLVSPVKFGG